jgi:hypothetical protein
MTQDLTSQIARLNRLHGFMFRTMLCGVIAVHGWDRVRQALIENASSSGDNVVSIAAAPRWGTTSTRPNRRAS